MSMARTAKKEKALTPEEKLAQALVPDVEQPYRVPENWCWVKWGNVGEFVAGSGFKNEYQGFTEYEIPFYKVGSLKNSDTHGFIYDNSNTINEEIRLKLKANIIPPYSVLFAKIGEAIKLNRRSINEIACCIDNNMMAFIPKCLMRYAFYWTCGVDLYEYANATTVPAIRKSDLEMIPFPLAPLAEQQRIVDRIESLFAKLDEAKEKAQIVVDGFEDRRAAILHKAFTGELTEEWRSTHGVSIDEWENAPLETVFQLRSGSTINASEEQEYGAIPYVKVADMNLPENEIQITTSSRFVDNCPESHVIPKGSTIFPKRGGAILTNKKRYVGVEKIIADLNTMAIIPIAGRAYGWYGYYWMQSVDLRQLNNGSNVPQINNKDMVKLFVPTPSTDEQKVIVGILDSIFEKEIETKESTEQVIDQIDTMKKSILARAFRCELGTNDPADESAVELLKRVL